MSRGPLMMVPGHEIGAAASGAPAPHDADGGRLTGVPRTAPGYARCVCGEVSPNTLPSGAARLRWLKRHREETAGVPWSDRVRQENTVRDWPKTFAERGIGTPDLTTWEESAPGCWTGFYSPHASSSDVARWYAVTDDASGLCVAAEGLSVEFAPSAGWWFRLADALAALLTSRGYEVTCAAPDCEYGRWPCPKRVAWAVTPNPSLGAWAGDPAQNPALHRPISIRSTDG